MRFSFKYFYLIFILYIDSSKRDEKTEPADNLLKIQSVCKKISPVVKIFSKIIFVTTIVFSFLLAEDFLPLFSKYPSHLLISESKILIFFLQLLSPFLLQKHLLVGFCYFIYYFKLKNFFNNNRFLSMNQKKYLKQTLLEDLDVSIRQRCFLFSQVERNNIIIRNNYPLNLQTKENINQDFEQRWANKKIIDILKYQNFLRKDLDYYLGTSTRRYNIPLPIECASFLEYAYIFGMHKKIGGPYIIGINNTQSHYEKYLWRYILFNLPSKKREYISNTVDFHLRKLPGHMDHLNKIEAFSVSLLNILINRATTLFSIKSVMEVFTRMNTFIKIQEATIKASSTAHRDFIKFLSYKSQKQIKVFLRTIQCNFNEETQQKIPSVCIVGEHNKEVLNGIIYYINKIKKQKSNNNIKYNIINLEKKDFISYGIVGTNSQHLNLLYGSRKKQSIESTLSAGINKLFPVSPSDLDIFIIDFNLLQVVKRSQAGDFSFMIINCLNDIYFQNNRTLFVFMIQDPSDLDEAISRRCNIFIDSSENMKEQENKIAKYLITKNKDLFPLSLYNIEEYTNHLKKIPSSHWDKLLISLKEMKPFIKENITPNIFKEILTVWR